MSIDKITNAPTPNEHIAKTNEVVDFCNNLVIPTVGNGTITIAQDGSTKGTFTTNQSGNSTIELDGGSGTPTDVQINGTSITSNNVANITSSEVINALGYAPANITLSNLGATSCTNFDGQWNYTFTIIHSATALGTFPYYLNATKGQEAGESSSNIFDILPNDNYKYELLIMASGRSKATGASLANIATTAWANPFDADHNVLAMRGDGSHSLYNNNSLVIPIDTDRKIQVSITNTKPDLFSVAILGYRRIGTNL